MTINMTLKGGLTRAARRLAAKTSTVFLLMAMLAFGLAACGGIGDSTPISERSIRIEVADSGRVSMEGIELPEPVTVASLAEVLGPHSRAEGGTNHKGEETVLRFWDHLGIFTVSVADRVDIINLDVHRYQRHGIDWPFESTHAFSGRIQFAGHTVVLRDDVDLQHCGLRDDDPNEQMTKLHRVIGTTRVSFEGPDLPTGKVLGVRLNLNSN